MIKKILYSDSIFILLSIFLFIIIRAIGFDGLYGQDAYEYLRYTRALLTFYHEGIHPGDYFWPLYYPLIGSLISFITGHEILILQLLSISSIGITAVYIKKIFALLYKEEHYSYIYIILFFILSPSITKIGTSIMSDLLATCFITLSFYHGIFYIKNIGVKHLYFTSFFAVAALMTRYVSGVVLFPLFLTVLFTLFKLRSHLVHLIPIILFSLLLISPHLWIRSTDSLSFLGHDGITKSNIKNLFSSSFINNDGIQTNKFPNLIYITFNIIHPIYLFLGSVLLLFIRKKDFKNNFSPIFIISIITYAVFIGCISAQNKRFLLLSFPLILVALYPAFLRILSISIITRHRYLLFTGFIIIQLGLNYISLKPLLHRVAFEKEMVALMNPYQNNTLYSFDIDIALQGRGLQFDYQNMYTDTYTHFNTGDLILFHPTQFKQQWRNKNPMINWSYIQDHLEFKTISDGPEGWKLYQIVSQK